MRGLMRAAVVLLQIPVDRNVQLAWLESACDGKLLIVMITHRPQAGTQPHLVIRALDSLIASVAQHDVPAGCQHDGQRRLHAHLAQLALLLVSDMINAARCRSSRW